MLTSSFASKKLSNLLLMFPIQGRATHLLELGHQQAKTGCRNPSEGPEVCRALLNSCTLSYAYPNFGTRECSQGMMR